jgi:hypothetical protein
MADSEISLSRIERRTALITVQGTAPLIMSRFDEKARQMMLDDQMQKTRVKKAPKNPEADFQRSMHRLPDGRVGFPAVGFKAATIGAARYFEGIAMTELRRALYFLGEGPDQLVPLMCSEPKMREDPVRLGGTKADLRHRAQFDEWKATLRIVYVPSMLTLESLAALVDAGGMSGVGEWRPGKADSGSYGTYGVVDEDEDPDDNGLAGARP